jgi:hypothetical protein
MKFRDLLEDFTDKKDWETQVKKRFKKAKFDSSPYPDIVVFVNGKQVAFWDGSDKEGTII